MQDVNITETVFENSVNIGPYQLQNVSKFQAFCQVVTNETKVNDFTNKITHSSIMNEMATHKILA